MEERIVIIVDSDVFKSQRLARSMAKDLGFTEAEAEEAAIVATELARNLIKHRALNGEITISDVRQGEKEGLQIVSRDTGPGIADLSRAMERSSVGTLGIGLSGVRRMSDDFNISSQPGSGTTVSAIKWLKDILTGGMSFSVLSRPMPGEDVSGDAWFIKHLPHGATFGVIDALGHGRDAYLTAVAAMKIIEENFREPLEVLVNRCHQNLRNTRGVAMTLCTVDYTRRRMQHVGVGNVETRIYCTEKTIRPFCFNGTVGMRMERFRVLEYPYEPGERIVMFSDGISGRFDQETEKLCLPPQELASWIFRNFAREHDDATVLVGE